MEVHPKNRAILIYLKISPDEVSLEEGFTRNVRNIGHYVTGDLELCISSDEDVEKAKPLIIKS